jgi:hypothetical protein
MAQPSALSGNEQTPVRGRDLQMRAAWRVPYLAAAAETCEEPKTEEQRPDAEHPDGGEDRASFRGPCGGEAWERAAGGRKNQPVVQSASEVQASSWVNEKARMARRPSQCCKEPDPVLGDFVELRNGPARFHAALT